METYQGGLIYWPACVVAMVTEASIGIIGDSINHGQNSSADPGGDNSVIARSVGLVCGYVNLGQSNSEAAAPGVVRVTNRMILLSYCSHITLKLGINDFQHNAGTTLAQVDDYLASIIALFPCEPVLPCTVPSHTTGACTLANGSDQTVSAVTKWFANGTTPRGEIKMPGSEVLIALRRLSCGCEFNPKICRRGLTGWITLFTKDDFPLGRETRDEGNAQSIGELVLQSSTGGRLRLRDGGTCKRPRGCRAFGG